MKVSVPLPDTLIQQLRHATGQAHQQLEKTTDLPHSLRTLEDLKFMLIAMLGYYQPLEIKLSQSTNLLNFQLPFLVAQRSALIKKDLLAIGMSTTAIENIELAVVLPKMTNYYHLLGAYYVIEGSSLGGQVLQRYINTQQLTVEEQPFSSDFFCAYGKNGPLIWRSFKQWCNTHTPDDSQLQCSIDAALSVFTTLDQWYAQVAVNSRNFAS